MTQNNKTKFKPDSAKASTGMRQTEIEEIPEAWEMKELGEYLVFSNGKSSPERDDHYEHYVYGSNGIIGRSKTVNTKASSIVVGRVGSYCGSLYFANKECWVTDNAIRASGKDNSDTKFFYYLLQTLGLNQRSGGSGQPLLNQSVLSAIKVIVPKSKSEQKRIASILSSLDDKIELNRRMNENLEEIGRTLFRRWFVEFEFPYVPLNNRASDEVSSGEKSPLTRGKATESQGDLYEDNPSASDSVLGTSLVKGGLGYKSSGGKMVDSELGMIPEGWRVGKVEDLAYVRSGYAFKGSELADSGAYSVIKIKNVKDPNVDVFDTQFVNKLNKKSEEFILEDGDLLVAMSGNTTGKIALTPKTNQKLVLNQRVGKYFSKEKFYRAFLYFYLRSQDNQEEIIKAAYGSAQPNISAKQLNEMKVVVSERAIFHELVKVFDLLTSKMIENEFEIQSLSQLRDSLLPRLMSGRVRV